MIRIKTGRRSLVFTIGDKICIRIFIEEITFRSRSDFEPTVRGLKPSIDNRGFQPWIKEATICIVRRQRFEPSDESATNYTRPEIGLEPVAVWFQHQTFTTRPSMVTAAGTHHVLIVFKTWCGTIATSFVHEGTGNSVGGWWGIRMCDRQTGGGTGSRLVDLRLMLAGLFVRRVFAYCGEVA